MISAVEWELLSLFEVEPELLDAELPWYYNTAVYKVLVDQWRIEFSLAPSYGDFTLHISSPSGFDWQMTDLEAIDLIYREGPPETLVIRLNTGHLLMLTIRPTLTIRQTWRT